MPKLTGRDNAERFINKVLDNPDKIVIEYGDNWPWMCNIKWREHVRCYLKTRSRAFRDFHFSEPDRLDGWTFVAYRIGSVTDLPIANRSLDDPEER